MIVENPYTQQHYLVKYFAIKSKVHDMDRRNNGDYYKKPTQYWFVNCEPENNIIFEVLDYVEQKRISYVRKEGDINAKVIKSLIHPQYCRRFIKQYLLDRGQT